MIIVPYLDAHLEGFEVQKEQMLVNKYIQHPDYINEIAKYGGAWTGIANDKPVIISGVFCPQEHLAMAWAILDKECCKHLVGATRAIQRFLNNYNVPRIETAVKRDFKEGHRFAKMLGFINETPEFGMKNYVDYTTYDLYARYNG